MSILKALRKKAQLSQVELAMITGISRRSLIRWEKPNYDLSRIPYKHLQRLGEYFRVNPKVLAASNPAITEQAS